MATTVRVRRRTVPYYTISHHRECLHTSSPYDTPTLYASSLPLAPTGMRWQTDYFEFCPGSHNVLPGCRSGEEGRQFLIEVSERFLQRHPTDGYITGSKDPELVSIMRDVEEGRAPGLATIPSGDAWSLSFGVCLGFVFFVGFCGCCTRSLWTGNLSVSLTSTSQGRRTSSW